MLAKIFLIAAFCLFSYKRLLTYLHIFQQEEYANARFLKWVFRTLNFDKITSGLVIAVALLSALLAPEYEFLAPAATALALLAVASREGDPRVLAKKKLALTARAKRILWGALAVSILGAGLVAALAPDAWPALILIQAQPFLLALSNLLLAPFESRVQRKYRLEAEDIIRRLDPFVIGITGSYGKTSVKHILGHVLECFAPTLITPGSVNTTMGISRIIRERLKPDHKFFVVEMGAYGIGSIERLCRLTPPRLGVVTSIGLAHFERFKRLENVARAKFELVQCVLDNRGQVIATDDVLRHSPFDSLPAKHQDALIACGSQGGRLVVHRIEQEQDGLLVELAWDGVNYALRPPLFGLHQGMNAALAFAAACALGFPPADVVNAFRSVPQIPHRLHVKQHESGARLIDDSYNSNPEGFRSALTLLDHLKRWNGRRVLVTPGMVELGQSHDEEHRKLGAFAAGRVDVVVAVMPQRIASFVTAFREAAGDQGVVIGVPSFGDAQSWLSANLTPDDVVLFENDLPDLYEKKLFL